MSVSGSAVAGVLRDVERDVRRHAAGQPIAEVPPGRSSREFTVRCNQRDGRHGEANLPTENSFMSLEVQCFSQQLWHRRVHGPPSPKLSP